MTPREHAERAIAAYWNNPDLPRLEDVITAACEAAAADAREEAAKMHTFTEQQVMTMLRNLGHDVECGACMSVAFTGLGFPGDGHTCGAPELELTEADWAELDLMNIERARAGYVQRVDGLLLHKLMLAAGAIRARNRKDPPDAR